MLAEPLASLNWKAAPGQVSANASIHGWNSAAGGAPTGRPVTWIRESPQTVTSRVSRSSVATKPPDDWTARIAEG